MKSKNSIFWRKLFVHLFFLLLSCGVLLLSKENLGRALFVQFTLIFWLLMNWRYKFKFLLPSILLLVFVLPFNVTIKIPANIRDLILYEPYVSSVRVIYLIPVISIIDFAVILILSSLFFEKRDEIVKYLDRLRLNPSCELKRFNSLHLTVLVFIGVLFLNLIIELINFNDLLSIWKNLRFLLWTSTGYFIVRYPIQTKKWKLMKKFRKDLFFILLIVSIIQVFIAIFQFRNGHSIGADFIGESELLKGFYGTSWVVLNGRIFLRGYGTFPHPNLLAAFFNLVLIFNLFQVICHFKSKIMKVMRIILILLVLTGIAVTLSRTGLLVAVTVLFLKAVQIVFVKCNKDKRISFGFFTIWSERVINLFEGGDVSFQERVELAKISLRLIKENWLGGVGWGRFITAMGKDVPRTSSGHILFEPVHNIFLLILAENGIILGGLTVISLLFFWMQNLFITIKERDVRLLLLIISFGVWFLVGANFDHYFWTLPQGVLMTLIFIFIQYLVRLRYKIRGYEL